MSIENAYRKLVPIFPYWVKLMEMDLRRRQLTDLLARETEIIVVGVPTDPGIALLAKNNVKHHIYFLGISEHISEVAKRHFLQNDIRNVSVINVQSVKERVAHHSVDCIIFNCYFDFCNAEELVAGVALGAAALKKGGLLISTSMATGEKPIEKIWAAFFSVFPFVAKGCHPVDMKPKLVDYFEIKNEIRTSVFGFPLSYLVAEKK